MKSMPIESVLWKEKEYYVAQCLNVDVSSFGSSKEEAMKNLHEAVSLFYEDANPVDFRPIEEPELIHSEISYA
jgi:predicted RNase H-like HicB family nuclease